MMRETDLQKRNNVNFIYLDTTMKAFFNDLFQYNRLRNKEMIDLCVGNTPQVSENTVDLFSHNLNAHHLWNHRITGTEPRYGVWDLHLMNSWDSIDRQNYEHSLEIIESGRLEENFRFTDSKGHQHENVVHDIHFHIVNHTTYHRAQIVQSLKATGLKPGRTDFIYYKR